MSSVSISFYVFESATGSNTEANVYANEKAELPVKLYVATGGTRVFDCGISSKKTVNDCYVQSPASEYPMPTDLAATKASSENERVYQSYPGQTAVSTSNSFMPDFEQTFLLKSAHLESEVGATTREELMAWVTLKGFKSTHDDRRGETVTIFSYMDATTDGGTNLSYGSSIGVTLVGKPKIFVEENVLDAGAFDADYMDSATIYQYSANYGAYSSSYPFELKWFTWGIYGSDGVKKSYSAPSAISPQDSNLFEFGFNGTKSGVNKVARAFSHGALRSGTITQHLHSGSKSYNYGTGDTIMSASAFYLKDAGLENQLCDNTWLSNELRIFVYDVYGGETIAKVYPNLEVQKDNHAKLSPVENTTQYA